MNLMLFQYGLPVIIGYVLFVGISGQFWPLRKPKLLSRRPSWLLGLWAASSVTLTLMLVLNMAYHLPSDSVQSLVGPSFSLLAALILPGLAVYFWYRRWIKAELLAEHRQANAVHDARAELQQHQESLNLGAIEEVSEEVIEEVSQEVSQETSEEVSEETSEDEPQKDRIGDQLDIAEILVEDEETGIETTIAKISADAEQFNAAFDQHFTETQAILHNAGAMYETESANDSNFESTSEQLHLDIGAPSESAQTDVAANDNTVAIDQDDMLADAQAAEALEAQLLAREEIIRAEMESAQNAQLALKTQEFENELAAAGKIADTEASLRSETEEHLRITRKAMINLESQVQKLESAKADDMIHLESQLEEKIRLASKAEANATRERQTRSDLENDLTKSRQELLVARTEIRKNTAARAKALASANKAVSFARQAVEARAQTESDLSSLKDRVLTQQTTISSLIKALETEKNRHSDELASLKSEFAQKTSELEIAANSKHSLGDAANQTLTTRLVKKVAKARPVV